MQIFQTKSTLRTAVKSFKNNGKKIGFVPTMGALHDGHLSLVRTAKKHCDIVIVSIFVNPTQFGKNEDLDKYPRNLKADIKLLAQHDVDILFTPQINEIYGQDSQISIDIGDIGKILEAKFRPDFLGGVMLIVAKLFNIVSPDIAIFGQKDYQQLSAIKKLVCDLDFDIKIIAAPIVREGSGLAMSSRNKYLSDNEQEIASNIYKILLKAKNEVIAANNCKIKINNIILDVKSNLLDSGFSKIDYVELVDVKTLKPTYSSNSILLIAVYLGNVRLIDNMFIS